MIGLQFRERLSGLLYPVQLELDQVVARWSAIWKTEHHPDGSHRDVSADTIDVSGAATFAGAVALGTSLTMDRDGVLSPPQITANTNDYTTAGFSTAWKLRLSTDAARNLTGLQAPTGRDFARMKLHNVGSQNLVLVHDSASSAAANQFNCPGAVNLTLNAGDSVWIEYDTISGEWTVEGI